MSNLALVSPDHTTHTIAYPSWVGHFSNNQTTVSTTGEAGLDKHDPHTGSVIAQVAQGTVDTVDQAVTMAKATFPQWSSVGIIERSNLIRAMAHRLEDQTETIAHIIHLETGKSLRDAIGEVGAAIEMAYFIAGEGRRFYGKTTTSAVANRTARTERQPIGVWGLIIAANTPLANVAWKVFPCLLAGNTAVLKPSENTPYTALWVAEQFADLGLPAGVLSVVQGAGDQAGKALVSHPLVDGISFTGSVAVGQWIAATAGQRLAKVCLELGGKNALLVCDDLDEAGLQAAVQASVLSAFSNAGQRCASASRLVVMSGIYDRFKALFLQHVQALRLGNTNQDDYGPVISLSQLTAMLQAIAQATTQGASLLTGGCRHGATGYYLQPTVFEALPPHSVLHDTELFGPITALYCVETFNEALALINDSPLGLTAAIHSANVHRTEAFIQQVRTGVVSVNGPTYGSEPHMPFGGLKHSGNGFREAGTEVLDVYTDWKTIYVKHAL
jgi:alpha-ketoglutaric semialdehyde dehydrogenase